MLLDFRSVWSYIYEYTYIMCMHTHIYVHVHVCTHAYNYSPFTPLPIHQKDTAECPFHKLFYLTKYSHLQMTSFNGHILVLSRGTLK